MKLQYKVIGADTPGELGEVVTDLMNDGWKPQGGFFMAVYQSTTGRAYQAMTRRTPE